MQIVRNSQQMAGGQYVVFHWPMRLGALAWGNQKVGGPSARAADTAGNTPFQRAAIAILATNSPTNSQ